MSALEKARKRRGGRGVLPGIYDQPSSNVIPIIPIKPFSEDEIGVTQSAGTPIRAFSFIRIKYLSDKRGHELSGLKKISGIFVGPKPCPDIYSLIFV